jgi:non-heme chloroperoxidase
VPKDRDDQIVPIADSALLFSKIIKGAKLVVYGVRRAECARLSKTSVSEELLAFLKAKTQHL